MSQKSRRGTCESLPDGWEEYTSLDGHLYYYNADTKERRWEISSKEKREALLRSHLSRRDYEDNNSKVLDQVGPLIRWKIVKKEKQKKKKTTEEQETVATAVKPSNGIFLKLQASLGGKLEAIYNGPPPMKNIRREGLLDNTGGTTRQEVTTSLMSVEKVYETETAGMSAAERLRFLRKKRQENMMLKRESSMGDDFMAEVANNMKKKGVVVLNKEERDGNRKTMSWEEQGKQEEERKRRQMQEEMEIMKEKKRNEQITKEREERREQQRAEQLDLEQRKQEQQEEKRKKQEKKDDPLDEHNVGLVSDCHETNDTEQHVQSQWSFVGNVVEQDDEDLDTSSPERVKLRRHNRSQVSKHDIFLNRQAMKHMESVEDDRPPAEARLSPKSEVKSDAVQDDKELMREKRCARKQREKDILVASKLSLETSESPQPKSTSSVNELHKESQAQSTSSIDVGDDTKARKKQLRRERRQMAKMEAALAAQKLDETGGQENAQPVKSTELHTESSNGPTIGLAHAGGYPMSGQPLPGQPLFNGGMYLPYPYMMMPPPPSPYGYCYPYVQPYSMPMPMYPSAMVPPGYQSVPPTPPYSANGMTMPSALIPYGTDSTLANAYGYDMNFGGMPSGPELSRCDCCKGIGVGLVEKNGVCAHCNRLRLAFIVNSAQMRLRCSVCGGRGFQLLQANGMCDHCTRSAQKSQRRILAAAARRPKSVATTVRAAPLRRISAKTKSEKDEFDDIDWDQSSLDDSDWDD